MVEDGKSKDAKDEEKEEKKLKSQLKLVRIMTVVVYLGAVTGGGTVLSLYYIIFWDPNIQVAKPSSSSGWGRYRRDIEHIGMPEVKKLASPDSPNFIDEKFAQRWTNKKDENDQVRTSSDSVQPFSGSFDGKVVEDASKDIHRRFERSLKDLSPKQMAELPRDIFEYPRKLRESTIRHFIEEVEQHEREKNTLN